MARPEVLPIAHHSKNSSYFKLINRTPLPINLEHAAKPKDRMVSKDREGNLLIVRRYMGNPADAKRATHYPLQFLALM